MYAISRNMNIDPRIGQMAPGHGVGTQPARIAASSAPAPTTSHTRAPKRSGR